MIIDGVTSGGTAATPGLRFPLRFPNSGPAANWDQADRGLLKPIFRIDCLLGYLPGCLPGCWPGYHRPCSPSIGTLVLLLASWWRREVSDDAVDRKFRTPPGTSIWRFGGDRDSSHTSQSLRVLFLSTSRRASYWPCSHGRNVAYRRTKRTLDWFPAGLATSSVPSPLTAEEKA